MYLETNEAHTHARIAEYQSQRIILLQDKTPLFPNSLCFQNGKIWKSKKPLTLAQFTCIYVNIHFWNRNVSSSYIFVLVTQYIVFFIGIFSKFISKPVLSFGTTIDSFLLVKWRDEEIKVSSPIVLSRCCKSFVNFIICDLRYALS